MNASGGATEAEVIACLRHFYNDRGLRPGTRNGPRHWSWFKTTVADYFDKKRDREQAANPSGFHEWEDRNEYRLSKAQFNAMTEAIEV
jgi:hypothetical protein